jgi:hypothetical protein
MELSSSDRRLSLWEKYGPGTVKKFQHIRSAETHVILMIDIRSPDGPDIIRSLYTISGSNTERHGKVEDNAEAEIARLQKSGEPFIMALALEPTIAIFKSVRSKIAEGLSAELTPNHVRAVILAEKGAILVQEPIRVGTN